MSTAEFGRLVFGKDDDHKDRNDCFWSFLYSKRRYALYYIKSSITSTTGNWPVGAMVARSPPMGVKHSEAQAEAVGSSPTSVAFFLLTPLLEALYKARIER